MKKVLSCLLIAVMCILCFVGCSKDGVPKGMYSATIEGEPFILYVPEGWTDNRDSGVSSAYYSLSEAVTVSARYYTPENIDRFSLDSYISKCIKFYDDEYLNFALVSRDTSALGTVEATRVEYTFNRDIESLGQTIDTKITVIQYYTLHQGDVVMLNLYAASEAYAAKEEYPEMFEQIRSNFVLCEKMPVSNDAITDKKTPEGMKLASHDEAEYRLYVPTSWVCNMSDKFSEAYYPQSGKPNVSVTSFFPDEPVEPDEYFAIAEDTYMTEIEGYELLSSEERTIGERNGMAYTYKAVYGRTKYRIMQVVFEYNDLIYSFTYTALDKEFEDHLEDVDLMIDSFRFR